MDQPLPDPAADMCEPLEGELVWFEDRGYGWCPTPPNLGLYNEEYFNKYVGYISTAVGKGLTAERVDLCREYVADNKLVVDVGACAGDFLAKMIEARGVPLLLGGYDVNPMSRAWLHERGLWVDPWESNVLVENITLWDVLEHLPDPAALLRRVMEHVLVSLPIFEGATHTRSSRHYKPGEHLWYWTRAGLLKWFATQGFSCLWQGEMEQRWGREAIETFVFRRLNQ